MRASGPCTGDSKGVENLCEKEVRYNWVYEKRDRRMGGREKGRGEGRRKGKSTDPGLGN